MGVTVIVATFGSSVWQQLALERAIPSAMAQDCEVIVTHERTLAEARNRGVELASGEWLVHLDADDRLDEGYAQAILDGTGDLRVAPLVEKCGPLRQPVRLDHRDIERVNPCHVGTGIRREMLLDCGGWPEFRAWEDWALFLRAFRRGAVVEFLPDDVPCYVSHSRPEGRNANVAEPWQLHRQIRAWA